MRLAYLGTPQMAVAPLRAVVGAGHEVMLVVTNPDRRRGRGGRSSPTPVKQAAADLGIDVVHDPDALVDVAARGAQLGVVVAYGRLIRPPALDAIPLVNLHFSLLPRWRGAAPVERAILAGDTTTGVCIMRLEEGLDTGGVYARAEVPIEPATTAAQLRSELVDVGSRLLVDTLARPLETWIDDPTPQQGEPTYARKIEPHELEIDWSRPPDEIERLVRLGGAWTTFRGKRLKIREASVVGEPGERRLEPTVVQPEGKAAMPYAAWRHGARPGPDERFG